MEEKYTGTSQLSSHVYLHFPVEFPCVSTLPSRVPMWIYTSQLSSHVYLHFLVVFPRVSTLPSWVPTCIYPSQLSSHVYLYLPVEFPHVSTLPSWVPTCIYSLHFGLFQSTSVMITRITAYTSWLSVLLCCLIFKCLDWYLNLGTWFTKNVSFKQKMMKSWNKQHFVVGGGDRLCRMSSNGIYFLVA